MNIHPDFIRFFDLTVLVHGTLDLNFKKNYAMFITGDYSLIMLLRVFRNTISVGIVNFGVHAKIRDFFNI